MSKPKWHVRPEKTRISLGIRPDWSVFAVRMKKLGSLATHWAQSEDSDQTGRMPRLIWGFAGRTSFCWFCHEAAQIISACNPSGTITVTNPDSSRFSNVYARTQDGSQNCSTVPLHFSETIIISECSIVSLLSFFFHQYTCRSFFYHCNIK